jgi:hypothetical protein
LMHWSFLPATRETKACFSFQFTVTSLLSDFAHFPTVILKEFYWAVES